MIYLTPGFRKMLADDKRDYIATADITLEDGTEFTLTNEEIWGDGFSVEDAVSEDESFTALGAAVINAATLVIDNTSGIYTQYDFMNADVVMKVALMVNDTTGLRKEEVKMGTFRVDDPQYNEATIELSMLDMMEQFDRPYSDSTLVYPATLGAIVRDACTVCAVTQGTLTFPHDDFTVAERPDDESCNFREVISWAATIAGCFARCNRNGALEIKWFNTAALEDDSGTDGGVYDGGTPYYQTGDSVDGGSFNPWNTGAEVEGGNFTTQIPLHYIGSLYQQKICVDETVITGVTAEVEDKDADAARQMLTFSAGTDGYAIQIKGNPFLTKDNAQTVVNWLGQQLIGVKFRKCSVTHTDDPAIEAGDVGLLYDSKGNEYPILITRHRFEIGSPQAIVCGGDSPSHNSSSRFSAATKSYVAARKRLKEQMDQYDQAMEDLREDLENNAHGLYADEIEDPDSPGSYIYCLHDKPSLAQSAVRIHVSTIGVAVTANATAQTPDWYAFRVDGTLLARVIQTMNLFFDYAHGGTITLGGQNNTNGAITILNSSGQTIGTINKDGANLVGDMISRREGKNLWANSCSVQAGFSDVVPASQTSPLWRTFTGQTQQSDGSSGPRIATDPGTTFYGFTSMSYRGSDREHPNLRFCICHDESIRRGTSLLFDQIYDDEYSFETRYTNPELVYRNKNRCVSGLYIHNGLTYKQLEYGVTNTANDVFFTVKKDYIYWGHYTRSSIFRTGNDHPYGLNLSETGSYDSENEEHLTCTDKDSVVLKISGSVVAAGKTGSSYMSAPSIYITDTIARINNTPVAFDSSSSIRYKHNIKPIEDEALDPHKLLSLPIMQFEWNDDHNLQYKDMKGKTIPGIIAEDVEKIYPAATIHDPETGEVESWDERRILPGMLALIQEQDKIIKQQQARLDDLEKKLESLTKLVESFTKSY